MATKKTAKDKSDIGKMQALKDTIAVAVEDFNALHVAAMPSEGEASAMCRRLRIECKHMAEVIKLLTYEDNGESDTDKE